MKKKSIIGFTLLELLVAVGIISLLFALGVNSYTSLTKQARDAKRVSDLQNIRSALEQYRTRYDAYPTNYNSLLTGYINRWPTDPLNWTYRYIPITSTVVTGTVVDYKVCGRKELNTTPVVTTSECHINCLPGASPTAYCSYQLSPLGE